MNRSPAHRQKLAPRARGLALLTSAVVVLTMFGLQFAGMNRDAWRVVLQPGPASLDQALAAVAGSLAVALIAWLLVALLVSLVASLAPRTSGLARGATNTARMVAPLILRNAVAALLGVAIAASPAVADARLPNALPQSTSTPHPGPALAADGQLSPAWLPALASDRAEGRPDLDLLPGWVPSRPPRSSSAPKPAPPDHAPVAGAAVRSRVDPDDQIVIRHGDTLWDIAARHLGPGSTDGEIALEWPHWFTANRSVIGANPDRLVPGERLRAPEPPAADPGSAAVQIAAAAREASRGGALR